MIVICLEGAGALTDSNGYELDLNKLGLHESTSLGFNVLKNEKGIQ